MLESELEIQKLYTVITKYKSLSPKTFRLVELTLDEIFTALSVINRDAF
jgi:hypothetical protein